MSHLGLTVLYSASQIFVATSSGSMGCAGAGSSVGEVGGFASAAAAGRQAGTQDDGASATGRLSDGAGAAAAAAGAALGSGQAALCGRQAPFSPTVCSVPPTQGIRCIIP